jgi:Uma2 family endonuclease
MIDALPEQYFRHCYNRGVLEISHPVIYNVPWDAYEKILAAFGDRRFPHTYADGMLEIMSPSEEHDWLKEVIGRLISTVSLELDIPIKSVGSTTRGQDVLARGLEPDQSYYVQHEAEVRGRKSLDSKRKLPPDLVVEVDISRKSISRFEAYAKLGVPEIWRYCDESISFHLLDASGMYQVVDESSCFPGLKSELFEMFVRRADTEDESSLVRAFAKALRGIRRKSL